VVSVAEPALAWNIKVRVTAQIRVLGSSSASYL